MSHRHHKGAELGVGSRMQLQSLDCSGHCPEARPYCPGLQEETRGHSCP
ncbi:rCG58269 [Rattus norvegicus]|uniref:RCG58269 n=1 Tax=Rattus norvegicus TaxID=10116 RepID=A6J448_RAT|nr:rCG58269 [Rattus norvegicus]